MFERRAPRSLLAVESAVGVDVKQGNTTREFPEALLTALTEAYQEAVGNRRDNQPS